MRRVRVLTGSAALLGALALTFGPAAPSSAQQILPSSEVTLPADAVSTGQVATASGISCQGLQQCVLVGAFVPSSGSPMYLAPVSDGLSLNATTITPLTGAGASDTVDEVSCWAVGSCAVVVDATNGYTSMLWSNGGFSTLGPIRGPAVTGGQTVEESITGLVCFSSSSCVAAGDYLIRPVDAYWVPFIQFFANGQWGAPVQVQVPTPNADGNQGWVTGLSCWTVNGCEVVGTGGQPVDGVNDYADEVLNEQPLAAKPLPPPADRPGSASADGPEGVSCPTPASCTAVAWIDQSGNSQPLVWTSLSSTPVGAEVPLPSGTTGPEQDQTTSISCFSAGNCLLGGQFWLGNGAESGIVYESVDGTWQAPELVDAPGAISTTYFRMRSVSCAATGECGFAGQYADADGNTQALEGTFLFSPGPVQHLTATLVGRLAVKVAWQPPADTGSGIADYELSMAVGSGPLTPIGTTGADEWVEGPSLQAGTTYTFAVTPATVDEADDPGPTTAVAVLEEAFPSTPRSVRIKALTKSVHVSWTPPVADGGGPLLSYTVFVTARGYAKSSTVAARTTALTIGRLKAGTKYCVSVAAQNAAGLGARSAKVCATPT